MMSNRVFTDDVDLEKLRELVAAKDAMDDEIVRHVGEMRAHGATWRAIGSAVGITRQGAFRRWGGKLGEGKTK